MLHWNNVLLGLFLALVDLHLFLVLGRAVVIEPYVNLRDLLFYFLNLGLFIFGWDRWLLCHLTLMVRWFLITMEKLLGNWIRFYAFKPKWQFIVLLSHLFCLVYFIIHCLKSVYGTHRKWYMCLWLLLSANIHIL